MTPTYPQVEASTRLPITPEAAFELVTGRRVTGHKVKVAISPVGG